MQLYWYNTPFVSDFKLEGVISRKENDIQMSFFWFEGNMVVPIPPKNSGYIYGLG